MDACERAAVNRPAIHGRVHRRGRWAVASGSDSGDEIGKKCPEEGARRRACGPAGSERPVAANRISGNSPGANSYELRNEILNRERIRYESDGKTVDGYTADQLFENAKGAGNHRRTLARNIDKGFGVARPAAVCAHHIVASQDIDANLARELIFACGIGINDVDNGVYLPRFKTFRCRACPTPHCTARSTRPATICPCSRGCASCPKARRLRRERPCAT